MHKLVIAVLIMFLPSKIKIFVLNLMGHKIHKSGYIGFNLLNVGYIELSENTYIGMGNIFNGVSKLTMGKGARINRWNYFTSSFTLKAHLKLGDSSSISLRHYFDLSGDINIRENTIIAGIKSVFFTHSKGIDQIDYIKPIKINDWCYIGSNSCFVPGSEIGSHCFVGMGSVVTKDWSENNYSLIAGNPAIVKKKIATECSYFLQKELVHPHLIK